MRPIKVMVFVSELKGISADGPRLYCLKAYIVEDVKSKSIYKWYKVTKIFAYMQSLKGI